MLRQRDVAAYLLEHGLIDAGSVVDGDLEVLDLARRNQNYKVLTGRGTDYMLKCAVGRDRGVTVAHEAAVFRHLTTAPGLSRDFAHFVPRFHGFDRARGVLVTELIDGGRDLRSLHGDHGRFPTEPAAALGSALGRLHRLTYDRRWSEAHQPIAGPPWILSIHRPELNWLRQLNLPTIELIKTIQRDGAFAGDIEALRTSWRASALIHADLRWDNCILSGQDPVGLSLVDWELANWGEPLYDVGSVFAEYLTFWLTSIPATGEAVLPRSASLARYPLEDMQPAMRAFWRAYLAEAGPAATEGEPLLERAVRFTAVRVVYSAFERAERALYLTGNVAAALQLSANMLARPGEAAAHLLGVTSPSRA
jgi:Ser/Thr protein kinase RdoA (MazF antagonist)